MANVRVFPPPVGAAGGVNPAVVADLLGRTGGRGYTVAVGSFLDVIDADTGYLVANGWTPIARGGGLGSSAFAASGPTASRPTQFAPAVPVQAGTQYVDTTLGAIIIFDGVTWRTVTGAAA